MKRLLQSTTTVNSVLETYLERFPWHCFATDDLNYGLHFMEADQAIKRAIVQHNSRASVAYIAFDIDSPTSSTDWIDNPIPEPNIVVCNPINGHAHFLYALETPVHNYIGASEKAIRYLAAVDLGMTFLLQADPGYAKLLSKNPFNKRWIAFTPRQAAYTLEELAGYCDLKGLTDRRRKIDPVGYGRNCYLFEGLRKWAYRERRSPQPYLSQDMFFEAVKWRGLAMNADFKTPLPNSEVRSAAKSISKWVWRKMSDKGFKEWGDRRREKSIRTKKSRAEVTRERILEAVKQCPTVTREDIALMCGVSLRTVYYHLRDCKV